MDHHQHSHTAWPVDVQTQAKILFCHAGHVPMLPTTGESDIKLRVHFPGTQVPTKTRVSRTIREVPSSFSDPTLRHFCRTFGNSYMRTCKPPTGSHVEITYFQIIFPTTECDCIIHTEFMGDTTCSKTDRASILMMWKHVSTQVAIAANCSHVSVLTTSSNWGPSDLRTSQTNDDARLSHIGWSISSLE